MTDAIPTPAPDAPAPTAGTARRARLYRMATPEHVCPYGVKAKGLLERRGYEVEDHHLTTRAETDAFKEQYGVKTTPQTFIGDERIGGYEALAKRLGHRKIALGGAYQPVLAIFAVSALVAAAMGLGLPDALDRPGGWLGLFIAVSMTLLAVQKLQDVEGFQTMFAGYDLLTQREPRYGYAYPFLEGLTGILMIAHLVPWLSAPIALFIGIEGGISVAKAVWIDKRKLKCACVGGDSEVPLGFISFTENAMMALMGLWTVIWLIA